jgi:phosphoserine phosphatase
VQQHGEITDFLRNLVRGDSEAPGLQDFEASYFYSDSINDLPLLEVVTHPIVTNPSESLLAVAQQRKWPVLNLFNTLADDKS